MGADGDPGLSEAVEWTKRFLTLAGDGEVTVRQVYGP